MPRICIIGAGVVGLSTAINVQRSIPDSEVTIIAERFFDETTSHGAAGIFTPTQTPSCSYEAVHRWCKAGFEHYKALAASPNSSDSGVYPISGYMLFKHKSDNLKYPPYHDVVYSFRELSERELKGIPGNYRYGWFISTVITECRRYLPYLMKVFRENGGKVERKTVEHMEEFVGRCDVLVNCSGVGSHKLFDDEKVIPVRGQLLRMTAPWIKHFYFNRTSGYTYIVPGADNVIIGGTLDKGKSDLTIQDNVREKLLTDAQKICPSLKTAQKQHDWVGVRPYRDPLRLERETKYFGNQTLEVVHNYGHGSEGVALSWGTSVEAAQLVVEVLLQKQAKL